MSGSERPSNSCERPSNNCERPSNSFERPSSSFERGYQHLKQGCEQGYEQVINGYMRGYKHLRNGCERVNSGYERVKNGNEQHKNGYLTDQEWVNNGYERIKNGTAMNGSRTGKERVKNGLRTGKERVKNGYRTEMSDKMNNDDKRRSRKTGESKKQHSLEKRQLVNELHAPARKNFPRRHVIVRGYDDLWQADIVEMRPYSRFNRGYHYILTVIDVLSKHAWAVPLKSKGGSETADAIAEIIRDSKRCPRNIQTDMGKEFYNADVQRLMRKHDINHYSTYSVLKASVVERFNRTLKNDMWKMFTLNGTYKWIDALPRLVSDYNARKHRTIGM
ncbi:integrase core domain-containing protein, partial [Lasius niger]